MYDMCVSTAVASVAETSACNPTIDHGTACVGRRRGLRAARPPARAEHWARAEGEGQKARGEGIKEALSSNGWWRIERSTQNCGATRGQGAGRGRLRRSGLPSENRGVGLDCSRKQYLPGPHSRRQGQAASALAPATEGGGAGGPPPHAARRRPQLGQPAWGRCRGARGGRAGVHTARHTAGCTVGCTSPHSA